MSREYAPVDADPDMDETPVRRFRLSRDGVARQLSPVSPTRATGEDSLDRALMEYHRSLPSLPDRSVTPVSTRPPVDVASPTPRRHDSVSSGSISSRPPSSQETFVNNARHERSQSTPQQAPWNAPPQQFRRSTLLPPIPSTSPLFQNHPQPFNEFTRPFSSASGPQIVQVSTGDLTRPNSAVSPSSHGTGYGFAPRSAYGRPNSLYKPGSAQDASLYASADPYHQISRSGSPVSDDDDTSHGYDPKQTRYSSVDPEALDEKSLEEFDASKFQPSDAEKHPSLEVDTLHYGPAPAGRQARRGKTKKKIALTQGHLVLDLPVPSR